MYFRNLPLSAFIGLLIFIPEISAQGRNQGFQVSIGRSFFGPAKQMSRYLSDNRYDARSSGFIFGPVDYPVETSGGTVLNLAYRWGNTGDKNWKVEAFYGDLGESTGRNNDGAFIEVEFKSIGLGISRTWTKGTVEFSLGPRILANTVRAIDDLNESTTNLNTAFAFGLEGSMDFRLWKSTNTYGLLGVTGLLTHGTEMGPFPEQNNGPGELEATTLNYSHGTFRFVFGVTF